MLPLYLEAPAGMRLSLLAIGAHPDDIEIGAGGTLLSLAEGQPGLRVRYVVLTGTADRQLDRSYGWFRASSSRWPAGRA